MKRKLQKMLLPFISFMICFLISLEGITQTTADLVLVNGNIITINPNDDIVEAVAIKDSLFVKVGTNQDIQPYIDTGTQVIDLDGLTVTPGMIDAHSHLLYYGQTENDYVNLRPPEVTSIAEILAKIEERISQIDSGGWVIGDGFFRLEDDRLPTRYDLDPISPNNPVVLTSMGGHFGTSNSYGFMVAGITDTTPDPPGGIIERDSITGIPTGVLYNHPAMDLVRLHAPPLDLETVVNDVKYAQEVYLTEGITSFGDVNTRGLTRLGGYIQTAVNGELKIRAYLLYTIEHTSDVPLCLENTELFQYPMIAYRGNKFLLDGQPPTSYTYDPHPGPSWNLSTWNEDTLKIIVKQLHRLSRQLSFHVMGDHAIDMALDAIAGALQDTLILDHRHRLEHVMVPLGTSLVRMKNMGVVACMQPGSIYSCGDFYNLFWPDQIQRLMPLRSMIDAGVIVSLGSDFPTVLSLDPRLTLWGALVRKTASGLLINQNERINMKEALYAHTMGSAYAQFEEEVKGSIEEGKYADMTIWSKDLYSIDPTEILSTNVVMTIVGGKVYDYLGIEDNMWNKKNSLFQLHQNSPNPFLNNTNFSFDVFESVTNKPVFLKLAVYNLRGDLVKTIMANELIPGQYSFSWDGTDTSGNKLTSAMYLVKLSSGVHAQVKKIVLMD